jgi:acyl carrier protein
MTMSTNHLDRAAVVGLVTEALGDVLAQKGTPPGDPLSEDTRLLGRQAVIDSLGLVTLIVDLEQRLSDEHGLVVTLADERAMSQKRSPFLTVGSLADYICQAVAQ